MNNNKKINYLLRAVLIGASVLVILLFFGNLMLKSPSVNPVSTEEFVCTEHQKEAKYKYTISYRGRSFLVGPKVLDTYPIFDLSNGEIIPIEDNDYEQVLNCIRMYNFHKEGLIGKSPAELRNGELIINPKQNE